VIDAVLGTGFSGEPREPVLSAIEAINGSGAPVIACDVPSGADEATGEAVTSVRADATVTFHGVKAGHLVNPAKGLCGEVHVVPIGIPPGAPEGDAAGLISDRVFEVLRQPYVEEPTNWSRRYKANVEKIASGDVIKVAEVVRDLSRRESNRGLSAGEKRMLAKARQILESEIALAENASEEQAKERINAVLAS